MGKFKTSFATEGVRRYMLQLILRSGSAPVRLPTDRELTETLEVSRVTVRRAIADLESGRYIIRIPGKQGIYTNPAMAQMTQHSIGLFCSSSYISNLNMLILGAMADYLMRAQCNYAINLFMLHDATPHELARELKHSGFNMLLSFEPSELVEFLLADGTTPVLAVEHIGYPERVSKNWFGIDHSANGKAIAETVNNEKFHKIIYCGDIPECRAGFEATLNSGEIAGTITQEQLITTILPDILKDKKCDAIICMLREVGIQKIYDVLETLRLPSPPTLILPPGNDSDIFQKTYPQYNTILFDTDFFHEQLKLLGKKLGEGVRYTLNNMPVESVFVNTIRAVNLNNK